MKPKKHNALAQSSSKWYAVSSDSKYAYSTKEAIETLTPDYKLDEAQNIFKPFPAK